ncbi:MAG: hypothetical protein IJO22_05225 [Oscillospiraceae bacterium]|nr:hypothetical protein [Oscillospiraceae bacterium]
MIVDLYLKVLNLSISAIPLIAALLVLRLLFKKIVPRKVFYIAWALVFLRLMVPFSLESDLSFFNIVPKAEIVEENIGTSVVFVENKNERVEFPVFVNPGRDNPNVDMPYHSAITGEIVTGPDITTVPMDKNQIYGTVWIFGTGALLLFGIIGYFAVLRKLKFESIEYTDKIRLSEFFKTPVVCGLIRPKIILPMNFDLDDEAKIKSVISHECTHIRRGDNLWRLLATFTLYVHWFNPLVWICYNAFIRDMEVSCDEAVLSGAKNDIRGEYAESLVALAGKGTNPLYGGVLSFGECAVKERVKCIMNFKKTTLMIIILCVAAIAALGVIFLTNPSVLEEGEQSVSYETFETENSKAVYSKENGLEIEVTIKNTDNKTVWLGPATYIYSAVEGNKSQFIGVYNNGGVLMIRKDDEALFCDAIPAEKFHESVRAALPAGEYILEREVYFDEGLTPTKLYADFHFEIKENHSFKTAEDIVAFVKENPDMLKLIENPSSEKPRALKDYTKANPEIPEAVVEFLYLFDSAFVTLEVPDFSSLDDGTGIFDELEQLLRYQVARMRIENDYNVDFDLEIEEESSSGGTYVYTYIWSQTTNTGRNPSGRDYWKFVLEESSAGKLKIKEFEYEERGKGGLYPGLENIFEDIKTRYYSYHNDDYEFIANIGICELMIENGFFKDPSEEDSFRSDLSGKIVSGDAINEIIPLKDFPEEEILGATEKAEYYRNLLLNITSGASEIKAGGITVNFPQYGTDCVVTLDEENAGKLMNAIEKINILTVVPMPNPNTGGMFEIYLETESNIVKIKYDGRLVLSHRGAEYASVFDGEFIAGVFGEMQNIIDEVLANSEEYSEQETSPAIGHNLYSAIYSGEVPEGKYIPKPSVLPSEVVWADNEQRKYCKKLIEDIDIDLASAFVVGNTGYENTKVGISKTEAFGLLSILQETQLFVSEPTNPNTPAAKEIHIVMQSGDYIKIVWDTSYFTLYRKGDEVAYRFDGSRMKDFFTKFSNAADSFFAQGEGTQAQYPGGEDMEHLIPDGTEPYVTLFSNSDKTAAVNYAIAEELRDLLTYENIERIDDPEEAGTSSPSLGKALATVDTIEFINKDDGKKYTLSLYEKGFVLSGSAPAKFNGAKITVEEDTWEYFINKINTEFENAEYLIPYWFGLVSPKRVKEVVVFGENGEKYSYTQKDDTFDNFFSIFKSDIKVSSLEERFDGNKIAENLSGEYIRVKIYFETGTVYEIIAERDYITMVSSDMNYGLRYVLEEKADAYDAFLDYAEGGPINAVTG